MQTPRAGGWFFGGGSFDGVLGSAANTALAFPLQGVDCLFRPFYRQYGSIFGEGTVQYR